MEDLYSFTTYNDDDTLTLYMFSEPVKYVGKANKAIKFIDNTIKQAEQKELSSSPALGGVYSAKAYTEGESIPFIDPATDEIALILGQADARDSYTGDETDGHFTLI